MNWLIRAEDTRHLLIGQCEDCCYRLQVDLTPDEVRRLTATGDAATDLRPYTTHFCAAPRLHHSTLVGALLTRILLSYAHTMREGWALNMPAHIWYWPTSVPGKFVTVPFAGLDNLSPTLAEDDLADALFPFQCAVAAVTALPGYDFGARTVLHVRIVDAQTVQVHDLTVSDITGDTLPFKAATLCCCGTQSTFTLNDEALDLVSADPLPLASPLDGCFPGITTADGSFPGVSDLVVLTPPPQPPTGWTTSTV